MERMITKVDELIKQHAIDLSNQYFFLFERGIEKETTFKGHLKDIKFDQELREFIDYNQMDIIEEFGVKKSEFKDIEQKELRDSLIAEIKRRLLNDIKEEYKIRINEIIIEEEKELNYAKEDELYYANREYLKDEGFEGNLTEEERTKEIEELKNEHKRLTNKIEKLNETKNSL